MNNMKTFILLASLTALFLILGYLIAGRAGIIAALVIASTMNFSAYWYSDKMVLKAFKAQSLDKGDAVYRIVAQLAKKAQIPVPKVYVIDNSTPNAFATGRNPQHAAIAVTSGLMQRLSPDELTGVLAHEMAHIIHRDTLISTVSATLAGAIASVAQVFRIGTLTASATNARADSSPSTAKANTFMGLIALFFAPLVAGLIQMAVSRSREFEADAGGAKLCEQPLWLASALAKLEATNNKGNFQAADEHPNTAHMFIINPLSSPELSQLFTTHPATAERIKRLQAMVI
ncbi:MAG: zinc metalloprotease HtpX [Legionella sp.]